MKKLVIEVSEDGNVVSGMIHDSYGKIIVVLNPKDVNVLEKTVDYLANIFKKN